MASPVLSRRRGWRSGIAAAAAGIFASLAFAASAASETLRSPAGFAVCDVTLESSGIAHRFRAEVADTPETRMQGLQGRSQLAADHGMLFDFGRPQPVAMWMKNTPISLDMLFIDAAGRVVGIAERTVPYSLATIAAPGAVRAVLEVPGGTVQRIGLKPGGRLIAPCLSDLPPP
jgi:uncharacterized membrane protein (UPF0127 family)